jgi:YD repeat-containing protein
MKRFIPLAFTAGFFLTFCCESPAPAEDGSVGQWARFEQTIDKNGYVTERVMYDQDNELLSGKEVPITQSKYDDGGLLLEQKYFDAQRQLMESPTDSVAVKQYKYDEFGHLTETILFDKNMNPKKS